MAIDDGSFVFHSDKRILILHPLIQNAQHIYINNPFSEGGTALASSASWMSQSDEELIITPYNEKGEKQEDVKIKRFLLGILGGKSEKSPAINSVSLIDGISNYCAKNKLTIKKALLETGDLEAAKSIDNMNEDQVLNLIFHLDKETRTALQYNVDKYFSSNILLKKTQATPAKQGNLLKLKLGDNYFKAKPSNHVIKNSEEAITAGQITLKWKLTNYLGADLGSGIIGDPLLIHPLISNSKNTEKPLNTKKVSRKGVYLNARK